MKIEKINSYLARNQFIVEVITDNGISGVGGSTPSGRALKNEFNNFFHS